MCACACGCLFVNEREWDREKDMERYHTVYKQPVIEDEWAEGNSQRPVLLGELRSFRGVSRKSDTTLPELGGNVTRIMAPCIVGVSSIRTPNGLKTASKRCGLITAARGSQNIVGFRSP